MILSNIAQEQPSVTSPHIRPACTPERVCPSDGTAPVLCWRRQWRPPQYRGRSPRKQKVKLPRSKSGCRDFAGAPTSSPRNPPHPDQPELKPHRKRRRLRDRCEGLGEVEGNDHARRVDRTGVDIASGGKGAVDGVPD